MIKTLVLLKKAWHAFAYTTRIDSENLQEISGWMIMKIRNTLVDSHFFLTCTRSAFSLLRLWWRCFCVCLCVSLCKPPSQSCPLRKTFIRRPLELRDERDVGVVRDHVIIPWWCTLYMYVCICVLVCMCVCVWHNSPAKQLINSSWKVVALKGVSWKWAICAPVMQASSCSYSTLLDTASLLRSAT